MIVIPGNHDSRNVGYVHFEELFGERRSELHLDGVSLVAVDSTEPDLDHGVIGRGRYAWIQERFAAHEAYLRVFVLHHHLLPVPGTGRERNVVHDAGDTLEMPAARRASPRALGPQARALRLAARGPLRGQRRHRLDHPPARQGQALLQRHRGDARSASRVWRKYPFHERDAIISFDPRTYEYEKDRGCWGRPRADEIGARRETGPPWRSSARCSAASPSAPRPVEDMIGMGEVLAGAVTDDFECVMITPFRSDAYRGAEGFSAAWRDWLQPYASFTAQIEDIVERDDLRRVPRRASAR